MQEYHYVAAYLPVRSWRHLVPFLLSAMRVFRQAQKAPGNVDSAWRTRPLHKQFWSLTIWQDRASIRAFVAAMSHARIIPRADRWAGEKAAFAEWTSSSARLDWLEAMRPLEHPTFFLRKSS